MISVKTRIPGVFLALALCLLSCAAPSADGSAAVPQETQIQQVCAQPLAPNGATELQHILQAAKFAALGNEQLNFFAEETTKAYALTSGCLLWIHAGKYTPAATQLMSLLRNASEKGLDPSDYDGHFGTVQISYFGESQLSGEASQIRFDVALTVAGIRYVSDLHHGRANPNISEQPLGTQEEPLDLVRFVVIQCAQSGDLASLMASIEPPFLAYRRTLSALAIYRELARIDVPLALTVPPFPIEPGILYKDAAKLRQRLYLLGDLSSNPLTDSQLYDVPLAEALARFQQRHGLEPNGRLDAAAVRELNVPLSTRVKQLELTLERWRWLPSSYSAGPIVVNIPEFRLHIVDDEHHITASMNVVVGRAYRHETPVFQGAITSILFRPPWNVPLGIQQRELAPLIEENPDYLEENSYDVLDGSGMPIPDSVSIEEVVMNLKEGKLFLRQRPGDSNSLGLIKFDLPNPYNVYLHGTPAQELFSKSRRDFSHGCVRVEDPVALAVWLLRTNPGWTKDRIEQAMHGEETYRVALERPVPIWIVYGTAVVLEDGRVRFFRDVYGQDVELSEQLDQAKREERFAP